MAGWVKLHRRALHTAELDSMDALGLWTWLLSQAAHKATRVYRGKGGRPIDLAAGQVVVAASSVPGMTRKRASALLDRFARAGMITVKTRRDTGHTITITKWADYQTSEPVCDIQGTYKGHTRDIQGTTAQEEQEIQESESPSPDGDGQCFEQANGHHHEPPPQPKDAELRRAFEEQFWREYPRRKGKAAAQAKFIAKAKTAGVEAIMAGLARAKAEWRRKGTELEFIPHPATWLNQGRWDDEPDAKPPARTHDPMAFGVYGPAQ
jgi:hypothetical protein